MWGQLIGLGVQAVSGVAGELMAAGREEEARQLLAEARAAYGGMLPPELERLEAEQLGPSAFEGLAPDAGAVAAQKAALARLAQMEEGGFTLEDEAALNRAMGQANRQEASQRAGLVEGLASRGALNSGAASAIQARGQQGAANRAADAALQQAAEASRRMYQAVLARGNMAGSMRGQDFEEKSRVASARDRIQQQNAALRQDAARFNTGLQQQDWQNRLGIKDRQTGLMQQQSGQAQQDAQRTRGLWGGLGEAARRGGQAYDTWRDEEDDGNGY